MKGCCLSDKGGHQKILKVAEESKQSSGENRIFLLFSEENVRNSFGRMPELWPEFSFVFLSQNIWMILDLQVIFLTT